MQYINPIELLNLQNVDESALSSQSIRKARKKLLAELDLSDSGSINYRNKNLYKSDIEPVLEELEHQDKLDNYYFLANFAALNAFLASGQLTYFATGQYQHPSLQYPSASFLELVSPFYAEQFNKALTNAFNEGDEDTIKRMFNKAFLVLPTDADKAYKGVVQELKNRINKIETLEKDLDSMSQNGYELPLEVQETIYELVDTHLLNILPSHFQGLRNQIAKAVRSISISAFNEFHDEETASDLLEHALEIQLDGLTKDKLLDDKRQITEIIEKHVRQNEEAAVHEKYNSQLEELIKYIELVKIKQTTPYTVQLWIELNISTSQINQLESRFIEIRNQAAIVLKALSVEIWNHFNDLEAATSIINKANEINITDQSTKDIVTKAKNQLQTISRSRDASKSPVKPTPTKPTPPAVKPTPVRPAHTSPEPETNQGIDLNWGVILFFIVILFGIVFAIANSGNTYRGQTETTTSTEDYSAENISDTDSTIATDSASTMATDSASTMVSDYTPAEPENLYIGNQLDNGASPFTECFGKGVYAGRAYIEFINDNAYDAVVCLVDVSTSQTIRNEYIKAGSTFEMSSIPTGTYYLKVYYGNDWNPYKTNFCNTSGGFEKGEHFSKSSDPSDYLQVEDTEYSYSTGKVTLYLVPGGNMGTQSTNESDFFN